MSEPSASAAEVKSLIYEFIQLYNQADQEEKACCDLTISQCLTLLAFESTNERLTMNTLSSRVGISTSTMTRHVDRLVRKGDLERIASEKDRRQVIVRLTPTGKDMVEQLRRCELSLSRHVLESIPADQWENVVSSLKLLLAALNARNQDCC